MTALMAIHIAAGMVALPAVMAFWLVRIRVAKALRQLTLRALVAPAQALELEI